MTKTPVKYSQELADEICRTIATSTKGTRKLCAENPHWPSQTGLYEWVFKHDDFAVQYARAKSLQINWLAEQAIETAYDESGDERINNRGETVFNNVKVNRDKLKVDTVKWISSKLAPKIYGNNTVDVNVGGSLLEKVIDKL